MLFTHPAPLSRFACTALFTLLIAALPLSAGAQSAYPNKPIRMIVPLAAASAVDNAARLVAQKMSDSMGQNIVIENIPGASGLIGTERVAKAAPDGYTIGGFNDSIMTMLPNLNPKLNWDILRDFEPVSLVGTIEWGLAVSNDAPYKNAADLIAAAKANPGRINYASGGNGSPQHIAMALFASTAGINMTHIPYKGATQAEMNLRGKFTTDAKREFSIRSVKPAGYPVPVTGPTGVLLNAQKRHNMRPAHLHFLVDKEGFKTIASQVYSNDDPYLDTDSQFGVTKALIGHYQLREDAPPAADVQGPWYSLEHTFVLEPGERRLPRAPISAKTSA